MLTAIVADAWPLLNAPDQATVETKGAALREKLARFEAVLSEEPYFAAADFTMVDVVAPGAEKPPILFPAARRLLARCHAGCTVSPDERNQAVAHAARIVVIALETHAQRLLFDADSDAEQEG
ncbi:glutathione S-transferase [Rhizobium sp. BK060]|nr:glutathione S-transferase [Rhizobium sp. BK060]